jgi:hypothetical protein
MTGRVRLIGIPLILVTLMLLISWIKYGEFGKIDACLDSGGAWDHSAKECRH